MKQFERPCLRWIFLLLFCLLWGGGLNADAAERAWAKFDETTTTLTFYYGEKGKLGSGEYGMPSGYGLQTDWASYYGNVITKVVFDASFAKAKLTSLYRWFYGCTKLRKIEGISNLNTSEVGSMRYMFRDCTSLESLDLSSFNTEKVTMMYNIFTDCASLTILDLSSFNTENLTTMSNMFRGCTLLESLDLSSFNTSIVTNMKYMFEYCPQLQVIYASDKFVVGEDVVTQDMFKGCTSLQGDVAFDPNYTDKTYATVDGGYFTDKQYTRPWAQLADGTLTFRYGYKKDLGDGGYTMNEGTNDPGWLEHKSDITRVVFDPSFVQARPKSCSCWFYDCKNLKEFEGMSNLNTSEVTNMYSMFSGCSSLASLDLSNFNTESVTSMRYMFSGCSSLASLDLSNFNTENVTDMYSMFKSCSKLVYLNLSGFSTANVADMGYMFYICSQLQVIHASDKFVVNADAQSTGMFGYCTNLSGVVDYDPDYTDKTYATVDGGYFTDKQYTRPWAQVADGTLTFRYGYKKDLGTGEYTMNEGTSSPGWNSEASSVTRVVFEPSFAKARPTTCCNWFNGCQMTAIEGLEYLNTSEVTTMGWMFSGCSKLQKLDLSTFDTRKVSGEFGMMTMFYGCSSLTSLDLSSFDTSGVTDVRNMFDGCASLDTLDLTSFDTRNVNRMGYMFQNCSNLKTIYASDKFVTTADDFWGYDMFRGCTSLKGYIAFDPNYIDGTYASTDGYFLDKQYIRPWAKLTDGTLTFLYGYKKNLGNGEYEIGEDRYDRPGWLDERQSVTRVVFDPSFVQARPKSCYCWFFECEKLTDIEGMENLNTSEVTSMDYMFYSCSSLTSLDLSGFDTQKVMYMGYMFKYSDKLQSIYVCDKFTTANVTFSMDMFSGCTSLQGNIAFDAAVTDKTHANIDGYFLDNQYVRPWAKIENGTLTFRYSYKKTLNTEEKEFELNEASRQPLWNSFNDEFAKVVFDPSFAKARPKSCNYWFQSVRGDIEGIKYLNTSEVKSMYAMFRMCGLSSLDLSEFDTRNVETMNSMFWGCSSLTSLDLSSFDTQRVTDMCYMFSECSKLTSIDLSSFNTQLVTDMCYMFKDDNQLQTIHVSDLFTADNVTSSDMMFYGCTSLKGNIAYDRNVVDKTHANASGYFIDRQYYRPWAGYDEPTSTLTFSYGYKPTLEESKNEYSLDRLYSIGSSVAKVMFDPSFAEARPTDCSGWFADMENLQTVEGIEYLNTSEVTDMNSMFFRCKKLTSLDLSNFDTRKVTNMNNMFSQCYQLTSLDISNFDTQQVTDMSYLFYGTKLASLDLSNFNTRQVTNVERMFSGCTELQSVYLGKGFSTDGISNTYEMFFDCPASLYCLPDCYEGLRNNSVLAEVDKNLKAYVPINAKADYGTLCVPLGSKIAEGTFMGFDKLYTVKKTDTNKTTVILTEATKIEPGVPYVYHRSIAEGAPAIIAFEADADDAVADAPKNDDTMLKGTFEKILAPVGSYILQMDGMFHPVAAGNATLLVGAYRAYLDLSSAGGETMLSKSLRIVFDGNASGIDSIGDLEMPKAYFDLSGRRVSHPQRGQVYIMNGKKVKM